MSMCTGSNLKRKAESGGNFPEPHSAISIENLMVWTKQGQNIHVLPSRPNCRSPWPSPPLPPAVTGMK